MAVSLSCIDPTLVPTTYTFVSCKVCTVDKDRHGLHFGRQNVISRHFGAYDAFLVDRADQGVLQESVILQCP